MNLTLPDFLAFDLVPMLSGILTALSCGLLGNFLVLRKMSLMGDAISHAVLPGIVAAFFITASRAPLPVFLGATASGLATVGLVELIRRVGRVEPGAAMGVVFSVLFALGVFMMQRGGADAVDLDPSCILHGSLELLSWQDPPTTAAGLFTAEALAGIPSQLWTQAATLAVVVVFITVLFKELRIAAFDAQSAAAQGMSPTLMHYLLMGIVAAAAVASFEAVGSILVIAMLICPAATARLLTERLVPQILVSAAVAVATGVVGYTLAVFVPLALHWHWPDGKEVSLSAAGMMTATAGCFVALAIVLSPTRGVVAVRIRNRRVARRVALEDLLARLYRAEEHGTLEMTVAELLEASRGSRPAGSTHAAKLGLVTIDGNQARLTDAGRARAAAIIRRHRLWEGYLVDRAGLSPDHVHEPAELLEHLPLDGALPIPPKAEDPHGRPIP